MRISRAGMGLFAAIVFCLLVTCAFAGPIITAKELSKIADDENVVIVSARIAKDYATVHIKNAVHVDLEDLYKPGDMKGILKSADEIAAILGSKGINENKTIVIYCKEGVLAGRLYWILDYLGAKDVRILDGQMKAWRKARKPVTKDATEIEATIFNASPNPSMIATMQYVKDHQNAVLVDVRPKKEYDGEEGKTDRKGHIPGAIHFEYKNVINESGILNSKEEIAKNAKEAGITSDKEIILYCETSARAGIVYLALKSILGYQNVKVYDGAMYEWAADASNPLDK